jgi:hypothetical protein
MPEIKGQMSSANNTDSDRIFSQGRPFIYIMNNKDTRIKPSEYCISRYPSEIKKC